MNYIMTILPPRLTAACNLGPNKMEQQTPIPPPPQIKDEAAQKPKRANFPSLIGGGGEEREGDTNFPSILSKTVGLRAMHELNIVL